MNEKLIDTIVQAIQDKKGKNISVVDLRGFDGAIASYFVICEAQSTTQVCAIADGVEEDLFVKLGEKVYRSEGKQNGIWVAIDFVDAVVHVFQSEARSFYKLDQLWADAPRKEYENE